VSRKRTMPGYHAPVTSWQERVADKIRSPADAAAVVRHRDRVFVGSGAVEPRLLVQALSNRSDLTDTEIVQIVTLGVAGYTEPRLGDCFIHVRDIDMLVVVSRASPARC
jgi:acyl-CoA hydrolase